MNDGTAAARNANPYVSLGVRPFINCASVRTAHSGSLMLPEVRAAIDQASRQFVSLDELMAAAGARIAQLTGAEWGVVTCGSAAALTLATAACVAGNDPVKMLRLPFTDGWPNRVIMLRNQRFAYDQAIRMVGTHIIEVASEEELEAALREPVVMVAILGTHEAESKLRMEHIVPRVKPLGIPVLVDAASEHIERPSPWLLRGADMVIYSGGKFLRGPQTSGLLLGRKDLIEAAWRNASPHQAFARGMKVSKEDIIGVLAALEYWFEIRDADAEAQRWYGDLAEIAARVKQPGVTTEVLEPEGVVRVPRLRVRWDAGRFRLDGEAMWRGLLDGEPRVMIDDMAATVNSIEIDPFGMQPGEATKVGQAIAAVLDRSKQLASEASSAAVPHVAGDWHVVVRFLHGERTHRVELQQDGKTVTGQHTSEQFAGPVRGTASDSRIDLIFTDRYEGSTISYRLRGDVKDGRMSGQVLLGSATDHREGPINLSQFGIARFEASRIG